MNWYSDHEGKQRDAKRDRINILWVKKEFEAGIYGFHPYPNSNFEVQTFGVQFDYIRSLQIWLRYKDFFAAQVFYDCHSMLIYC